jgi:hypothetical protein
MYCVTSIVWVVTTIILGFVRVRFNVMVRVKVMVRIMLK